MIATNIFVRTVCVENFVNNFFGNLKFFEKVHISRDNREKAILGPRFDPFHKGGPAERLWVSFRNTWSHTHELPINEILGSHHFLTRSRVLELERAPPFILRKTAHQAV